MDFTEAYRDTCSTVAVASRQGNVDALRVLLADGKPYDVKDYRGWTCVHEAASNGHVECLDILLNLDDVDVDGRTFEWETALMLASGKGNVECVNCLIRHGADPNARTHDKDSPLCRATKENHLDCVKALLENEAHVNQKYFTDDSPLHIAISCHGNIDVVSYLVSAGADLLSANEHKLTPLFLAAQFGREDCLKFLIESVITQGEYDVQTYIDTAAYDEATPLYVAAQSGFTECVKILLNYGADPLHGPLEGESSDVKYRLTIYPIQAAINSNSLRCVQLLFHSLKHALWQYNYQRMDSEYNPFILAQQQTDYRILLMMLDELKEIIDRGFCDIFNHDITLHAAAVYMKFDNTWFIENYHQFFVNNKSLLSAEICVMTLKYAQENSVLQSAVHKGRQPEIHMSSQMDNVGFLALIKYFHGYCKLGELCTWCLSDLNLSWLTGSQYLMRLCLTPFISSMYSIRNNQLEEHLELYQRKIYKGIENRDVYRSVRNTIAKMLVANSLQHNCRVAIVFQLAKCNNYNSKAIDSLAFPGLLKNYLKFTEYGKVGQEILDGFQALDSLEKKIDEVFEEVSNEMSNLDL